MGSPKSQPFNCADQGRPSWLDRALKCAALIAQIRPEHGEFVVSDIGCGDMKLARCLQTAGVSVTYRGYDLVPQLPEVTPLDVRTTAPGMHSDVITLMGVIEYLDDFPSVLRRLRTVTDSLVLSHVVRDTSDYSPQRLAELGWKQYLYSAELEQMLRDAGFRVDRRVVTDNGLTVLWRCSNTDEASAAC